jgi:hypothetical protein
VTNIAFWKGKRKQITTVFEISRAKLIPLSKVNLAEGKQDRAGTKALGEKYSTVDAVEMLRLSLGELHYGNMLIQYLKSYITEKF